MMCEHCVAHVKKALEGIEGVSKADVSLAKNNAILTLEKEVSDEAIKAAVEEAGYHVK
jgi:Cu2+-exporting ATPase